MDLGFFTFELIPLPHFLSREKPMLKVPGSKQLERRII